MFPRCQFLVLLVLACRTGVIGGPRPVIEVAAQHDETFEITEPDGRTVRPLHYLVGSKLVFGAGLFELCRTRSETEGRDWFGKQTTKTEYEELSCNEQPLALVTSCAGVPCEVLDNKTSRVVVVPRSPGTLEVDARVLAADGKVRQARRVAYSIVAADRLIWYAYAGGDADATGCPSRITHLDQFPAGAVLRSQGRPVRWAGAASRTARACIERTDAAGEAATCWDIPMTERGAFPIPGWDVVRVRGGGVYKLTVTFEAMTLHCTTLY
ncbi:MAG: hypothetical protein M4D80_24075 [Myxococcota bacterium]|nr:hypothetical protein [Deltaproteobacteria bacterium]MDQ3338255.1 hypothetical protein [Myxococcota bacterium]